MHEQENTQYLEVETDDSIYEIELGPIQIEITGRCNMNCIHCRADEMPKVDMPVTEDELVFDGCPAATVSFNVNADGTMTPCSLLNLPMINITNMTIEEIATAYQNNPITRGMLEMNLGGKCGACNKKYQCGGCRARALVQNSHVMAEDPECWI